MTDSARILNASIGGFTTMRQELLKSASRQGGSLIPRHWTSNKGYAELVNEGLVTEEPETNVLMRRWKITAAGRDVLHRAAGDAEQAPKGSQDE
jgi:hypothetical protein